MYVNNSRFAQELNSIVDAGSLSPQDIVAECNKHGFPLPLYTFFYWLQGYFLPRSHTVFQLISVLESICGVRDNRLSDALMCDLSSGSSFVPGENIEEELGTLHYHEKSGRFSSAADDNIDTDANIIEKAVREEVFISTDHTYVRHKTTILARVPSVPDPTFVFTLFYEDGEESVNEETFFDISGMTLHEKEIFDKGEYTVCSAHFRMPDDIVPGDLHRFSYSWDLHSSVPFERLGERFFPWTLDFYSCAITFDGDVPQGIRYVTREIVDGAEREVPWSIDKVCRGNTVSISTKNIGNIVGGFWFSS